MRDKKKSYRPVKDVIVPEALDQALSELSKGECFSYHVGILAIDRMCRDHMPNIKARYRKNGRIIDTYRSKGRITTAQRRVPNTDTFEYIAIGV